MLRQPWNWGILSSGCVKETKYGISRTSHSLLSGPFPSLWLLPGPKRKGPGLLT